MAAKDKDTIYIDIDDEITGIIDKLQASNGDVVALVLPKRAAVFQSIVNMKLLKRAADSGKKNLVLITSEAGLLPLAGAAGVYVAKTLTSKPAIPSAPTGLDEAAETVQEDAEEPPADPLADKSKTVGQLAGSTAVGGAAAPAAADGIETLTLDNEEPPAITPGPKGSKSFEPPTKSKKNKKLHVPNFERFRLLLIIGGLLLLLIIGGLIFATVALPKATINIKTDATNVQANLSLNLSTSATSLDPTNNILPSKLASQQKTYTEQVPTTGQKNNGNKASGSVGMTATECSTQTPTDVPAGTGLSANGLTYITQGDTSFSSSGDNNHHGCLTYSATSATTIIAQNGGANYNGADAFTVAGRSDVSVQVSSAIAGGTDSIVQTVNQNDINSAKSKVSAASDSTMQQALESQLKGESYYPIPATYVAATPAVTSSANVGDVANNVTVTETITYTMFGVHESDLNTLINNQVNTQIDTSQQSILDTGLSKAVFNLNTISASAAQLSMSTKAIAGPQLNTTSIKQQAAGKKAGAIKSQISNNPDVTNVTVNISPFWVSSAPKKTSRITVNIAKPSGSPKTSSSSGSNP